MENRLKLKISKLFETCRSKNIPDVSAEPFFFPENRHHRQLIALFSPNPHFLSKPKCQIDHKPKPHLSRPKQIPSVSAAKDLRRPLQATKKNPRYRKPMKMEHISSTTDKYYYDWRSSDDEYEIDDETTLFSSRSFRSESSGSFKKNRANRKSEKKLKRTNNQKGSNEKPLKNSGKLVNDSFAVAKKSSNPHEDFRVSMVEMIVGKQIFEAEGLTKLFECFISLNSDEHHRVIFEVFTEILEAMFSFSS
ncbi:hypothetical protein E3N88_35778 [Mikania micrantha]|uniref:Transcription repressor n=1 Tax=Mikania micrantha TaxID=192012 RepID=A0A5N6M288_9ASTR|nr:hypothetical protein E3N88_35778 [Mikania micrantha]